MVERWRNFGLILSTNKTSKKVKDELKLDNLLPGLSHLLQLWAWDDSESQSLTKFLNLCDPEDNILQIPPQSIVREWNKLGSP